MTQQSILLIEDEDLLAGILEDRLNSLGYQVIRAKDGESGSIQAKETTPDLIITDILLPVVDGVTMIKNIREEGNTETPIIILTNLETVEGIDGVIIPPRDVVLKKTYFTLEKLLSIVKEKMQELS